MIASADPVTDLLCRLEGVKPAGDGYSAKCPAHDDRNASLSIRRGKSGNALLYCHAGCERKAILGKLGRTDADLFVRDDRRGNGQRKPDPVIAHYEYRDADNEVIARKSRTQNKFFFWQHPDGNGGWANGRNGAIIPLYNLPAILNAREDGHDVLLVEGEKDVDRANVDGFIATTSPDGASKDTQRPKWRPEFNEQLAGLRVAIICDNDDAGRAHGENAAQGLKGKAKEIRLIRALPGVPEHGDLSDYLDAGGTAESLRKLIDATPVWTPENESAPALTRKDKAAALAVQEQAIVPVVVNLAGVSAQQTQWLWPGRIPFGYITLLVGRPGDGKSFFTVAFAAMISNGSAWPDGSGYAPLGSVLFISLEDSAEMIRLRADAHHADASKLSLMCVLKRTGKDGDSTEIMFTLAHVAALEAAIIGIPDLRAIIIDPIGSVIGGDTDAHRDNEVRSVLAPLAALANKYNVAMLVVAHRRKNGGSHADTLALGSIAFTGIARVVLHLSRDTENKSRRLLLPGKNNLAPEGHGLAFTIAGDPAHLQWEENPVTMNADEALAAELIEGQPGPEPQARTQAVEWLTEYLATGPKAVKEIQADAKAAGVSWGTLKRAKAGLPIKTYREQFGAGWWWKLLPPKERNQVAQHPQRENLAPLAPLGIITQENNDFREFLTREESQEPQEAHVILSGEQRAPLGKMEAAI